MSSGDLSLSDELERTRLAMRAAWSESFKSSEIIAMMAKGHSSSLREKLSTLSPKDVAQRAEILTALQALKEPLSPEEVAFLATQSDQFQFIAVSSHDAAKEILDVA